MLVKDFIETREDGHTWYDLHSDTKGKAVRIVELDEIYGNITMRDDDPHTFEEVDDPDYDPEMDKEEESSEEPVQTDEPSNLELD